MLVYWFCRKKIQKENPGIVLKKLLGQQWLFEKAEESNTDIETDNEELAPAPEEKVRRNWASRFFLPIKKSIKKWLLNFHLFVVFKVAFIRRIKTFD